MATPARVGYPSGTVEWSDGTNFTGVLWVELVPPSGWTEVGICGQVPHEPVSNYIPIMVRNGQFASSEDGLFFNADLSVPSTYYVYYAYEGGKSTQIAGPSAHFSVSGATFTFPSLTLTAPSSGTVVDPDA